MSHLLHVEVTRLEASVPAGVPVRWRGREFSSGPLTATLDASSKGVLDYSSGRAAIDFRVKLDFPEFAAVMRDLGLEESFTAPLKATIESRGAILDDHSFSLDGPCHVSPHALMDGAAARMLPGT